jgi:hypothetical protein
MNQLSTVQQVKQVIMFGDLSNDELNTIIEAVKYARVQMSKTKTRTFRVGDLVKFTSNRNGMTYNGTVDKVKIKNILVRTNAGLYNVPANMLEAA